MKEKTVSEGKPRPAASPQEFASPPTAVKREILQSRVTLWKNTLYAAQVQARVARAIGSRQREDEAAAAAEQALRALDELAAILAELEK